MNESNHCHFNSIEKRSALRIIYLVKARDEMASISSRRQTSITRFINLEETHAGKVKTDDVLLRL